MYKSAYRYVLELSDKQVAFDDACKLAALKFDVDYVKLENMFYQ